MYIDHRYEVLESLGSGTWAKVFKVKDIRSGHFYTLKLFQYLSSEDLYARFSAEEMHHITRIEHPNLSHVVDFWACGRSYLLYQRLV
jgi:serine/threonine protein kinase